MAQKFARFIIISAINAILYSVIIYFMEVKMEPLRFVLQALFFGFLMGFMQVFGLPYMNRNKKQ
jgi:RsiW-degrading membrane proteinase PrsW (M82 family)